VAVARPRVLDLGAGTGRIGWPFVAAGDDYVGADLSFGMLQAFVQRSDRRPWLVQADGHRLPFCDASFDAVLLVQVFGGIRDWQQFAAEVRREDIQHQLGTHAADKQRRVVGTWSAERTARQFIARHRGGARFSALPESVKDDAMARLGAWAAQAFGSLDAASAESHAFELQIFKFEGAVA